MLIGIFILVLILVLAVVLGRCWLGLPVRTRGAMVMMIRMTSFKMISMMMMIMMMMMMMMMMTVCRMMIMITLIIPWLRVVYLGLSIFTIVSSTVFI